MASAPLELPDAGPGDVAAYLRAALRERRWAMTGVCLLQGAAALAGLVAPAVLGMVIDRVVSGADVPLWRYGFLVFVGLLLQGGFGFWSASRSFAIGEEIFDRLRRQFFDRLLAMPVTRVERVPTGEIVSRSTNDMDGVQEIVRIGVPEVVVGAVSVLVTVVAGFVINPIVALGMLVGVPLLIIGKRRYARGAPPLYARELRTRASLSTTYADTIAGADEVANFGLGEKRTSSQSAIAADLAEATKATIRFERRSFPMIQAGYHLPLFGVIAFGAAAVATGNASLGAVASIAMFTRSVLAPLDDLMYWFNEAYSSSAAMARILGVAGEQHQGSDDGASELAPSRSLEAAVGRGLGIAIDDLSFCYEGAARDALHKVSGELRPAQIHGIVGRTGSGKSTLALILAGILKPDSGTVTITDPSGAVLNEDTAQVTLLTQHDHVFAGSVRENLQLAAPFSSEAELWDAATAVGAAEWIRGLRHGLENELGTDGYTPTAAEARQLSLARIILKKPSILILDEATAALPQPERVTFAAALRRELASSTILHIAHDLDIADGCDTLFVMEDGQIIERGTPEELAGSGGTYSRLRKTITA